MKRQRGDDDDSDGFHYNRGEDEDTIPLGYLTIQPPIGREDQQVEMTIDVPDAGKILGKSH